VEAQEQKEQEHQNLHLQVNELDAQLKEKERVREELELKKKELEAQLQAKLLQKQQQVRVASVSTTSMLEQEALNWIIAHEGGPTSVNPTSHACGLAQSLPCSKILSYAGVDMSKYNLSTYDGVKAAISTVPAEVQRAWMIEYCNRRYGSVANAQMAWLRQGWY
jgi:hypothetical protein